MFVLQVKGLLYRTRNKKTRINTIDGLFPFLGRFANAVFELMFSRYMTKIHFPHLKLLQRCICIRTMLWQTTRNKCER